MVGEIGDFAQRRAVGQQRRAAHRKDLLDPQARHIEIGPVAVAVADRHVDAVVDERHMLHRGADAQIDIGMGGEKGAEARHQPFCREGRRQADGQRGVGPLRLQGAAAGTQPVERVFDERQVALPGGR